MPRPRDSARLRRADRREDPRGLGDLRTGLPADFAREVVVMLRLEADHITTTKLEELSLEPARFYLVRCGASPCPPAGSVHVQIDKHRKGGFKGTRCERRP